MAKPQLKASRNDESGPAEADNEDDKISSSDSVVEYINSGILNGRFVPGQRLIEGDLTRMLGLSRGPVREAFRRLDALGILTRALHRGAYVRTLHRFEAADLLAATEPLTGLIAKLAAEAIAAQPGPKQIAHYRKVLRPYRDGEEDAGDFLHQRHDFYDALIMVGGNSQLGSILPTMRIHLLRLQVQSALGAEDRLRHLHDYAEIAGAVLDGDAKKAEKLARQHIRNVRDDVLSLPDVIFPKI